MCDQLLMPGVAAADRVDYFISCDPAGDCQNHQVSRCSCGPVANDEMLARSVDFPLRDDHQGGLNDTLFQDAFSMGASVQRISQDWANSAEDIHGRYEKRAEGRRSGSDGRTANPDWTYIGAIQILASELRKIQLADCVKDGRVRVYDTADDPHDPNHADVMVDMGEITKSVKEKRKLLRVMLLTEACKRGVFVTPNLASDDPRIQNLQITLHR